MQIGWCAGWCASRKDAEGLIPIATRGQNRAIDALSFNKSPAPLLQHLWHHHHHRTLLQHNVGGSDAGCYCLSDMDPHRLPEERSIAYHSAIAERLRDHPELLENARRRVEGWLASSEGARFYAQKWAEILKGDASSVAAFLVERSELAAELRPSSPFAGALRPQERWRIWRETRERFQLGP